MSVSEISDTVMPNGILIISPGMHPLAIKKCAEVRLAH